MRSYIAEPERGRRCWDGKPAERDAVYRNRRRIRGAHGKALLRSRGELLERPFAHALETGGMRRTHLRRHENILKRLLIHLGGLNLGLLMRTRFGIGTPRGLQGRADRLAAFLPALWRLWDAVVAAWVRSSRPRPTFESFPPPLSGWRAVATSGACAPRRRGFHHGLLGGRHTASPAARARWSRDASSRAMWRARDQEQRASGGAAIRAQSSAVRRSPSATLSRPTV